MVKDELCVKVVEVRRVNDRVVVMLVFEEDVLRLRLWGCSTKWMKYWKKSSRL